MAALTIHPAGPAISDMPARPVTTARTRRRGHLALVGTDFVSPARPEPVAAAPVPEPATRELVLTRRGRQVLGALAFVIATALSVGLGAGAASLGTAESATDSAVVTVAPGQSLWSIATAAAEPGEDVRDVVAQISSLNGLSSDVLRAGQELRVPQG